MSDFKVDRQDEINALAKGYYFANQNGDKAKRNIYWEQLFRIIVDDKNSQINNILQVKLNNFKVLNLELSDVFYEELKGYDYEKNPNFCAYILKYADMYLLDENKKRYKSHTVTNEDGKKVKEKETRTVPTDVSDVNPAEQSPDSTPAELVERKTEFFIRRQALLSSVINFYSHNSGKSANEQRLSYYRIFFTDYLLMLVDEIGSFDDYNSVEFYANSDKNYVRFISYSDYKKIEDILNIRYKLYSEVIDGYDKEDKRINVPCENVIIQQYRYKSGLDSNEVSFPNITQQRKKYKESLEKIYNMIGEG